MDRLRINKSNIMTDYELKYQRWTMCIYYTIYCQTSNRTLKCLTGSTSGRKACHKVLQMFHRKGFYFHPESLCNRLVGDKQTHTRGNNAMLSAYQSFLKMIKMDRGLMVYSNGGSMELDPLAVQRYQLWQVVLFCQDGLLMEVLSCCGEALPMVTNSYRSLKWKKKRHQKLPFSETK